MTASREQKLRQDAATLSRSIQQQTRQEVFAITRKTLAELASASLEAGATEAFIRRLRLLEPAEKSRLEDALAGASEPVLIRSAFALPDAQRSALQQALHELFASDRPLRFDTSDKLVSGIELSVDGQRVAWNIDAYLSALEDDVDRLLDANQPPPASGSATRSPMA